MNNVSELLDDLSTQVSALATHHQIEANELIIIGIRTGGLWVAQALHERLQSTAPLCSVNVAIHRDDYNEKGLHPTVEPSDIACSLNGKTVLLVDDVLHTGRTIRAAMNEVFDFGRPRQVLLAVMFERTGRQLPITADVVGQHIELADDQDIKLLGPAPLEVITRDKQ